MISKPCSRSMHTAAAKSGMIKLSSEKRTLSSDLLLIHEHRMFSHLRLYLKHLLTVNSLPWFFLSARKSQNKTAFMTLGGTMSIIAIYIDSCLFLFLLILGIRKKWRIPRMILTAIGPSVFFYLILLKRYWWSGMIESPGLYPGTFLSLLFLSILSFCLMGQRKGWRFPRTILTACGLSLLLLFIGIVLFPSIFVGYLFMLLGFQIGNLITLK